MTWYIDRRHPELGAMYVPDSEPLGLPPGMTIVPPPITSGWIDDIEAAFGRTIADEIRQSGLTRDQFVAAIQPGTDPVGYAWARLTADERRTLTRILDGSAPLPRAAHLEFQADAEFINQIARAFGVPIEVLHARNPTERPGDVTQPLPASEHLTGVRNEPDIQITHSHAVGLNVPQRERDARLAEGRCYWCGGDIDSDDPLEMFDREPCERAWRAETQADITSGGITVNPYSTTGYAGEGPDMPREPGEEYPRWLGTPLPGSDRVRDYDPAVPAPTTWASWVAGGRDDPAPVPVPAPVGAVPPYITGALWDQVHPEHRSRNRIEGPLPALWDWQVARRMPAGPRGDRMVATRYDLTESTFTMPGVVIPKIETLAGTECCANASTDHFAVGRSWIPDHPALQELDRGPVGRRTAWPNVEVEQLTRDGFDHAYPLGLRRSNEHEWLRRSGCRVPAWRYCPRCNATKTVALVTADFAYPHEPLELATLDYESETPDPLAVQRAAFASYRTETHIVCSGCMLPYPGPTLVPLWRRVRRAGMVELALAGTRGYVCLYRMSDEVVTRQWPDGFSPTVRTWEEMHIATLRKADPHPCVAPRCTEQAMQWVALATAMSMWGYVLRPVDADPMILGLCPHHHYDLCRAAYAEPSLVGRANPMRAEGRGLHVQ